MLLSGYMYCYSRQFIFLMKNTYEPLKNVHGFSGPFLLLKIPFFDIPFSCRIGGIDNYRYMFYVAIESE